MQSQLLGNYKAQDFPCLCGQKNTLSVCLSLTSASRLCLGLLWKLMGEFPSFNLARCSVSCSNHTHKFFPLWVAFAQTVRFTEFWLSPPANSWCWECCPVFRLRITGYLAWSLVFSSLRILFIIKCFSSWNGLEIYTYTPPSRARADKLLLTIILRSPYRVVKRNKEECTIKTRAL